MTSFLDLGFFLMGLCFGVPSEENFEGWRLGLGLEMSTWFESRGSSVVTRNCYDNGGNKVLEKKCCCYLYLNHQNHCLRHYETILIAAFLSKKKTNYIKINKEHSLL